MNARHALVALRTPSAIAVAATAAVVGFAPNAAIAADNSGQTISAALGADGSASSVRMIHGDGTSSSYNGDLPITMKINHTSSATTQTYGYHVENNVSKSETIHYDDTAGRPQHTTVTVQLPLVAQLSVDVPKSLTNVSASGATVTTSPGGTRRLSWRDLRVVATQSPPRGALHRSLDPEGWDWSSISYLIAGVIDLTSVANWQRAGDKHKKRPEPIPRPGSKAKKPKRKSLTAMALASRGGTENAS